MKRKLNVFENSASRCALHWSLLSNVVGYEISTWNISPTSNFLRSFDVCVLRVLCLYVFVSYRQWSLCVCVCVLRSHHSKYSGVCGAIIFVFLVVMRVVVDYKRINSIWFVVLFTHTVNRSVLGIPLNSRKKETQPRIHTWSESVSTFARVTNTTNGARGGKCFCWCVGGTFFLFSNFRCFFYYFGFVCIRTNRSVCDADGNDGECVCILAYNSLFRVFGAGICACTMYNLYM